MWLHRIRAAASIGCIVMLNIGGSARILMYRDPVDMRKSIDGLSFLVSGEFLENPSNGSVYVFFNRQKDKVKLLYWDRNGFCMWYKRLEKQHFKIPKISGQSAVISAEHFRWLMDGLDVTKLQGFKALKYELFC